MHYIFLFISLCASGLVMAMGLTISPDGEYGGQTWGVVLMGSIPFILVLSAILVLTIMVRRSR